MPESDSTQYSHRVSMRTESCELPHTDIVSRLEFPKIATPSYDVILNSGEAAVKDRTTPESFDVVDGNAQGDAN